MSLRTDTKSFVKYLDRGGGEFSMATYLVTGANRGIGLEYCRQLQQRGETVIAACRSSSPELDALGI